MSYRFSQSPVLQRWGALALIVGASMSQMGMKPAVADASASPARLCPFAGTEINLEVGTIAANRTPSPDLVQAVATRVADRVDRLEVDSAAVFVENPPYITVQLPAAVDLDLATHLLGRRGSLTLRPQRVGASREALYTLTQQRAATAPEDSAAIAALNTEMVSLFGLPRLYSHQVVDAETALTTPLELWSVTVEFSETGDEAFTKLTQTMAGTGRAIGIFLDDELISAPIVDASYAETGITGGRAVISGSFTQAEAEATALQIQTGAFPAPIEIVSVQAVTMNENCETE